MVFHGRFICIGFVDGTVKHTGHAPGGNITVSLSIDGMFVSVMFGSSLSIAR